MHIEMAHLQTQGLSFAVFNADSRCNSDGDRGRLLRQLVESARRQGLRVDKAALAFSEFGRTKYYGTPDLVQFLASRGVPRWTHTISV